MTEPPYHPGLLDLDELILDAFQLSDTEPWPDAATGTRSTSKPYAPGPSPSNATAPDAAPDSACSETAPSHPAHPAQHGTSATTRQARSSQAPNTDAATDTKAQSEATTSEQQHDGACWCGLPQGHPLPAWQYEQQIEQQTNPPTRE